MSYRYLGPVDAVNAVADFLGTSVLETGILSFNDELALYRTARSLTEQQLPDVAAFNKPLILGPDSPTPGVNCGIEWVRYGEEDENNSRSREHEVVVAFWVPASAVLGNSETAMLAAQHYLTVLAGMWARATVPGSYGYTLNDYSPDGSGVRVERSEVLSAAMVSVDGGINELNYWPSASVSVTLLGDYPGV